MEGGDGGPPPREGGQAEVRHGSVLHPGLLYAGTGQSWSTGSPGLGPGPGLGPLTP